MRPCGFPDFRQQIELWDIGCNDPVNFCLSGHPFRTVEEVPATWVKGVNLVYRVTSRFGALHCTGLSVASHRTAWATICTVVDRCISRARPLLGVGLFWTLGDGIPPRDGRSY